MSVRTKLMVIVAFVALAPLVMSALMGLRVHQRAFDGVIAQLGQKTADAGAQHARDYLDGVAQAFRLLAGSTVGWRELSRDERAGALWLVYRQHAEAAAALLVVDGTVAVSALKRPGAEGLDAHPIADDALAGALLGHLPAVAAPGEVATGAVFASGALPIWPIALAVDAERPAWTIALGLSLAPLCQELAAGGSRTTEVLLVDAGAHDLCTQAAVADERLAAAISTRQRLLDYRDGAGRDLRAVIAAAPHGLFVVARQPIAVAFAASRTLRDQTFFWIALSLLVALGAAALLAPSITRPVSELARAAGEVGQGRFEVRLPDGSGDELGRLASAFNLMCAEIEKRDAEIRGWNRDLQARVDDRTRELNEAQAQLLQSQKIAAVSSLGAGIAHEVNNPLTGVIGFAQLLLKEARQANDTARAKVLEEIERQALRIREVVQVLLSFSESYAGAHATELHLNAVMDDAVRLMPQLGNGQIEIVRDYAPSLPTVLGNGAQVQQVILQLFKNAVIAMSGRGQIRLATSVIDGQAVKVTVADNGKGIATENLKKVFDPFFTTKDDPAGEGLGLTMVHRIVEEHHGTVKVESTPGNGATFTITLPAGRRGSHMT